MEIENKICPDFVTLSKEIEEIMAGLEDVFYAISINGIIRKDPD